jgi:hypothetical protein
VKRTTGIEADPVAVAEERRVAADARTARAAAASDGTAG